MYWTGLYESSSNCADTSAWGCGTLTSVLRTEERLASWLPPLGRYTCSTEDLRFLPVKFNDKAFVGGTKSHSHPIREHPRGFIRGYPWIMWSATALANCIILRIHADNSEMDYKLLLVASLLGLPEAVICNYPWPDNVTQYKGYIQVSQLAAGHGRAGLLLVSR